MLSHKPKSLRNDDLFCCIMQYLAVNTGKVVTPSLITTTINKRLGCQFTTNKTVSNYLDKICEANLVHKLDREYISLSDEEPSKLGYNRTYFFSDFALFAKCYDYALKNLFKDKGSNALLHDIAVGKTVFLHKCVDAGYDVKSGVLSFFTHLEAGKTKKNTLSFDFVIKTAERTIYVVFQNEKDFDEEEFTIEAKFALKNIINGLSVLVITTSPAFIPFEIDGFRYVTLDEVLAGQFEI